MRLPIQGVYIDGSGNIVVSGTATFYEYLSSNPSNPTVIATIYAARTGGSAIASGAVTTDSNGAYIVWVEDTDYDGEDLLTLILTEPSHAEVPWHFVVPGLTITHTHANDANGGNALAPASLNVGVTGSAGRIARFITDTTGAAADVLIVDQDNSATRAALQIQGNAGAIEALFVASNGHVGIGIITPASPLEVRSDGGVDIQSWLNSSGLRIAYLNDDSGDGRFQLRDSGDNIKVFLDTTGASYFTGGNLGVGVAPTAEKLEVEGNIRLTAATGSIFRDIATDGLVLSGGTSITNGANIHLTGGSAAGSPNEIFVDADTHNIRSQDGLTDYATIASDGQMALGLTVPDARLHIVGDLSDEVTLQLADNDTNSTAKVARMGFTHYTNAEEYVIGMAATMGSTTNILRLGGGDSVGNAVTELNLYAAADNTTTTGTLIVKTSVPGLQIQAPATLILQETVTPSALTGYGKIYPKADNKLYFQDGAGTEHELAFAP